MRSAVTPWPRSPGPMRGLKKKGQTTKASICLGRTVKPVTEHCDSGKPVDGVNPGSRISIGAMAAVRPVRADLRK